MGVIRWEEPGPEPYTAEDVWAHGLVAELRERPGEWAVVHETESPNEAQLFVHAIAGQRHLWPAVRNRRGLLAIYACWSKTRPEPSSSSATVYTFPSSSEQGDDAADLHDDRNAATSDQAADQADPSTPPRARWWHRRH